MIDLTMALIAGIDIPIPECKLIFHQPTIKEISFLGEQSFFTAVQTLSFDINMVIQDEVVLQNANNFQVFMTIMTEKETQNKRDMIKDLFQLIFPKYSISYLPNSLLFSKDGETSVVDENNFEYLQEVTKSVFCFNSGQGGGSSAFNPADEQARQIAQKLMRGRQRVAAQHGSENANIFSQYVSSLTIGLGSMSLVDCLNLTMFQLFDLVERYMLYQNWDIDIRSRLAGATPNGQPENWMKNIH